MDLAEEIVQESPTRIGFRLKKGIPWSDNLGEVTAEDVKYSYERIADPEMKAAYRVDWEKLDKVEVTGTHTGVIILKQPFMPLWISTLPAGSGLIMCKKAMEKLPGQKLHHRGARAIAAPTGSRSSRPSAPWSSSATRCGPARSPTSTRSTTS